MAERVTAIKWSNLLQTKVFDIPTCTQYHVYSHIKITPETQQHPTQRD